jgi:hypothetical protein
MHVELYHTPTELKHMSDVNYKFPLTTIILTVIQ